ncbi:MAG: HDOD domain-containing protein [Vicinamibacterales bacterium]
MTLKFGGRPEPPPPGAEGAPAAPTAPLVLAPSSPVAPPQVVITPAQHRAMAFERAQSGWDYPGPTLPDDSLAARVEKEISSGRVELPVLPEAAVKIRTVIAEEGGLNEIVEVIGHDPALAAAILRHANSAAFSGLRDVVDLQQAVVRLGLQNVERTVLALSAREAFGGDHAHAGLYRALWTHSMTTAIAARRLAPRTASFNSETIFLAALLHDIGKVVVLRCAADMHRQNPKRFSFQESTLREFFQALHCRTGDALCEAWHLPAEIRDVMRRHHDTNLSGPDDSLVAIVQLANLVSTKLGASLTPDAEVSLLDTPGAALLRLDDVKIAALLVEIEDDVQRLQDLLC